MTTTPSEPAKPFSHGASLTLAADWLATEAHLDSVLDFLFRSEAGSVSALSGGGPRAA